MKEHSKFKTEQEEFWAGDFGTQYILRNQSDTLLASNLNFYSNALRSTRDINSCIEFGANIGMNLKALRLLYPKLNAHAIEINAFAVNHLKEVVAPSKIYNTSILLFEPNQTYDLVLIKGVLIHISPDELTLVYDKLNETCGRYLMISE